MHVVTDLINGFFPHVILFTLLSHTANENRRKYRYNDFNIVKILNVNLGSGLTVTVLHVNALQTCVSLCSLFHSICLICFYFLFLSDILE